MIKLYLVIIALVASSTAYFGNNYLKDHSDQADKVLANFVEITPTSKPTLTPVPPTSTPEPSITPTPTPEPSLTPTPQPTTIPSSTPKVTNTPTPTTKPTNTPLPKALVVSTSTPMPTAKPTVAVSPTPSPTIAPVPTNPSVSSAQINEFINKYAGQYAVDPNVIRHVALCESGLNPNAKNLTYGGLFQFSASTWASYRNKMNKDPHEQLRFNAEAAVETAAYVLSIGRGSIWPNCMP